MRLWVLADNPACRFYEALGGRRIETKRIDIGDADLEEVHREFSLITLDAPTGLKAAGADSFYSRVIWPLLHLPADQDNLYGWLEVMFAFCCGKPFAYYSRYVPSARIHRIAARFRVRVLHRPLRLIPSVLLRRYRTFRFLWVTRRQWEAIVAGVREGRTPWGLDQTARREPGQLQRAKDKQALDT